MYHGCMGEAPGTEQCSKLFEELLDHTRELVVCMECNKPCMCQEKFMQSANLFLHGETIVAI